MLFGSFANAEAAKAAEAAVRSPANFNWTTIFLLAVVVVIYLNEWKQKNYKGIAAALALYSVHWMYEIGNALICHFTGYALWTVSAASSSFIRKEASSVGCANRFQGQTCWQVSHPYIRFPVNEASSSGISSRFSMVRYEIHFPAFSFLGASIALVGQASMQRVHWPHLFSIGLSGVRYRSVTISPRKK